MSSSTNNGSVLALGRLAWPLLLALALVGCRHADSGDGGVGPYDRAGRLVELPDGRKLNLRCVGRGTPTVVLEAGFGAGAEAWARVQPELGLVTRTCSYDRAGYGFSDPGPSPRDGAAVARDLDQLLEAAQVEGPYIFVGHSAGALYGRLFAARRPGEVAGLILLDPTVERIAPAPGKDGLEGIRRRLKRCLGAAETVPQPPAADPRWEGCVPSRERRAEMARSPERWRNQLSELDAIFGRTSAQVRRTGSLLEDVPAYIITASDTANTAPRVGPDDQLSVWKLQHIALASKFRLGFQRTVLSSHLIPVERPEVVTDAASRMVTALRRGEAPPSPGPDEGQADWPTASGSETIVSQLDRGLQVQP